MVAAEDPDRIFHITLVDRIALFEQTIELIHQVFSHLQFREPALQHQVIASDVNDYVERFLYEVDVPISLSEEAPR